MKTMKYYLLIVILFLGIGTRGQKFRNFKRIKSYNFDWILPLDFEQKFKLLQQDVMERNLEVALRGFYPAALKSDSITREKLKKAGVVFKEERYDADAADLMRWFDGYINLSVKEGCDAPYPKEWLEAIPTAWTEQLKKRAEQKGRFWTPYFTCKALVNHTGEVLSVYFKIDTVISDLVREENLQAIHDAVIKKSFNPDNFDFRYLDKKLADELRLKIGDPKSSNDERLIKAKELFAKKKPCEYGVLDFFKMMREERDLPAREGQGIKACKIIR